MLEGSHRRSRSARHFGAHFDGPLLIAAIAVAGCCPTAGPTTRTLSFDDAAFLAGAHLEGRSIIAASGSTVTGVEASLLRVDSDGSVPWALSVDENVTSVASTGDGTAVVAGFGRSAWLMEIDQAGGLLWQRRFAGAAGRFDEVVAVDGGFVATGHAEGEAGTLGDALVVRTDRLGTAELQLRLRSAEDALGRRAALQGRAVAAIDGDLVVAGVAESAWNAGFVVRLNGSGSLRWARILRNPDPAEGIEPTGMIATESGELILVGSLGERLWISRFSADGDLLAQAQLAYARSPDPFETSRAHRVLRRDGGLLVVGELGRSSLLVLEMSDAFALQATHANQVEEHPRHTAVGVVGLNGGHLAILGRLERPSQHVATLLSVGPGESLRDGCISIDSEPFVLDPAEATSEPMVLELTPLDVVEDLQPMNVEPLRDPASGQPFRCPPPECGGLK